MAEGELNADAQRSNTRHKEDYWLPSARGLGAAALPLYHAELNRALGAYALGDLDQTEVILDALLNGLEQVLSEPVDEATASAFHLLYASVQTARGRTYERRMNEKKARNAFRIAASEFDGWIGKAGDVGNYYCDFGVALFKIGRKRKTIQAFESARQTGTLNSEAYRYLGICYCKTEDYARAEEAFAEALKEDPGDSLTRRALAECLETQGKIPEAISEYNHVALFLTTSGMFDEANKVTAHMMELDPKDERSLSRAGEALLAAGSYEKALEVLDDGLRLQPKNAIATRTKGLALLAQGNNQAAAKQLRRALKLDPTLNKARVQLASALNKLGDFKDALVVLDEALAYRPDDPDALIEKGNTLSSLGRNAEALETVEKALAVVPNNQHALLIKGQVLTELEDYKQAVRVLERAIKYDPTDARTYGALGQAASLMGNNTLALEALEKSLAIRPDYAPALAYKGEILRAKGEDEAALQVLNQAVLLSPDDPWILGTRGQVLRSLGRNQEAIVALEKCVEKDPSLMWAHGELIAALYSLDRLEETLKAIDHALKYEVYPNWLVFKGQVLNEIAAFESAIKAANKAIKLDHEFAQAYGVKGWAQENLRRKFSRDVLATYEYVEKIEPANVFWQLGVANALYLTNKEQAPDKYRSVIDHANALVQEERPPNIVALIAWCEIRLGNFERAAELFKEALAAEPGSIGNVFNLGLALICGDRGEEALREYQRGLRLLEAKVPLGRRGEVWTAIDDLELAIEVQPKLGDVDHVKNAVSLLKKAFEELPEIPAEISA